MANPQPDKFLKYSIELLEAKARFRLSGQQNQFFEATMLMTYGDIKNGSPKFVQYSGSEISKKTGLSKQTVYKVKHQLISMLVLKVVQKDYLHVELIGINKDYDQWRHLPKKTTGSPKRLPRYAKKTTSVTPAPIIVKERKKKKKYNKRTSDFHERFWPAYPVKKSKQKAIALWESLASSGKLPPTDDIITAIEVQKKEKRDLLNANQFCPEWKHPTTWLYQGCWDDEPIVTNEQQQDEERERLCKMLDEEMEQERLRCGQPIQLNDWKAGSTKN